jgi:hypothetical protein
MKPANVASKVKAELSSLTGLDVDTVSGVEKSGDDWNVVVEMVELTRIPNSSDVLASYAVAADDNGDILSYRRTRRYLRADSMEEQ